MGVLSVYNGRYYGDKQMNNWTQEIPKEPGFYWFATFPKTQEIEFTIDHPVIVAITIGKDGRLRLNTYHATVIELEQDDFCYVEKFVAIEEKERGNRPYWCRVEDPPNPIVMSS
jgi:hypothetical protein